MKCPYTTNSVSIELETTNEELSKAAVYVTMLDCVMEDYGAYQNGRCIRTS